MRVVICVAAALLAGCTTYGQMAAMSPHRVETVMAAAGTIKDCTLDGARRETTALGIVTARRDGVEHVMAYPTGLLFEVPETSRTYVWDIGFVPIDATTTRIEVRSMSKISGHQSDIVWPIVARCAKAQPTGPHDR